MIDFSIVIPAYNEADKITTSLTQVVNFMRTYKPNFEVIVSDDGSTDATAQLVLEYQKNNPEVVLLKNLHKGKGPTVWSGMHKAQGNFIYMADADLSSPISELKKLVVWATDQNFDVVLASREGIGSQRVDEPLVRHLMGRIFNMFVQLLAVPGINDTQCGFKLFKGAVAHEVFERLQIYNATTVGELKTAYLGAWDVEVLYLARKLGYTIKEVPVKWTYVKTNRLSHVRDSIRMLRDVIKIRLNDICGKYNLPKQKLS